MTPIFKNAVFLTLFYFSLVPLMCGAVGDRNPIKDTQTDVVAVTQELLTREGEPGPSSPTFKMSDTSLFFSRKPFEYLDKDLSDSKINSLSDEWEDWFSTDNSKSSTEALEQKELK